MPVVYVSREAANPTKAHMYIRNNGATALTEMTLPAGVVALDRYPQILKYRKRTYYIGMFSRMIMRDEYAKVRAAGVKCPRTVPALADGSFSLAGETGEIFVAYQTFVTKQGHVKIAESDPGAASNALTSAGGGRTYSGLDNAPEDAHVTHSRLYVSVDGEISSLAAEIPLPHPTTYAEGRESASLGEPLPARTAKDGSTVTVNSFARGVPPYCKYAEEYHEAFFYAGDPNHPERIYPSRLFEPEAVNSTPITFNGRTEEPWLNTTDGSPVTGIKRQGDELVVGTLRGIDIIQGYSPGDYSIRRVSNYWGVISHFSMRRAGPLGSLWFASPHGVSLYNAGAFRYLSEPIETWWLANFALYPDVFENCYGIEDRASRNYRLLLPNYQGYSYYLNANYFKAEVGEPIWVTDRRARGDRVMAELVSDTSRLHYDLYTGSCDGYVRKENVASNADDDGDTFQKKWTARSPHRYPRGQDGDDAHGNTYVGLNLHLKHPNQDAVIKMFAGDDDAASALNPQWQPVYEGPNAGSPATAAASSERQKTKRTSEHHPLRDLAGKGYTVQVEVVAPTEVEYRGQSVDYIEGGPNQQPFTE